MLTSLAIDLALSASAAMSRNCRSSRKLTHPSSLAWRPRLQVSLAALELAVAASIIRNDTANHVSALYERKCDLHLSARRSRANQLATTLANTRERCRVPSPCLQRRIPHLSACAPLVLPRHRCFPKPHEIVMDSPLPQHLLHHISRSLDGARLRASRILLHAGGSNSSARVDQSPPCRGREAAQSMLDISVIIPALVSQYSQVGFNGALPYARSRCCWAGH